MTLEGLYRLRIGKVNVSFPREFWVTAAAAIDEAGESQSKYVLFPALLATSCCNVSNRRRYKHLHASSTCLT